MLHILRGANAHRRMRQPSPTLRVNAVANEQAVEPILTGPPAFFTLCSYAALLNAALNFASASLERDVFSTRGL
jgi:hypothetical protein